MSRTVRVVASLVFLAVWMGGSAFAMHQAGGVLVGPWLAMHAASAAFCLLCGTVILRLVRTDEDGIDDGFDALFPASAQQVGFGVGNCTEADLFGDSELLGAEPVEQPAPATNGDLLPA